MPKKFSKTSEFSISPGSNLHRSIYRCYKYRHRGFTIIFNNNGKFICEELYKTYVKNQNKREKTCCMYVEMYINALKYNTKYNKNIVKFGYLNDNIDNDKPLFNTELIGRVIKKKQKEKKEKIEPVKRFEAEELDKIFNQK